MDKRGYTRRQFISRSTCAVCALAFPLAWGEWTEFAGGEEKEAMFYTPTPRGIKCRLCPHQCNIKEGDTGDCRVRYNKGGKLFTRAWNNPCAVHVDPVEKKPLLHFLPGSTSYSLAIAGCNFTCLNCQNWEISQTSPDKTRNYDLSPEQVVNQAKKEGCRSISYTYSEPVTFFEYTLECSRQARKAGIKNIVVSNGYINPAPLAEWCKVIDAANIDLKSFDDEIYTMLNNGSLEPVLNTLIKLKENGIWLEITNLIVPEWTDDMEMIRRMCQWLAKNGFKDTPLHFSRFYPQYKLNKLQPTSENVLKKAREIALGQGLQYVYIGNIPGRNYADTFCPNCHSLIIERVGYTPRQSKLNKGKCGVCGNVIPGVWE
ncbi:MAG: pyruvate formate lyase activating enzyme [Bacteroidales bacterium]|jgi:pyruvate formate lyase activating enzyme|nr:pyruvate formate lyase activating enzyme [Bacteroidales bacterium]MDN5329486.1 pyruvate formate lyase activating enzyme [Bacteroidales bacterium]